MSTLADMRGLQEAYSLKQALTQTDDRLFGSEVGTGGSGGGSLNLQSLAPILSNNGRGFFRNAAKNLQPVIKREDVTEGSILEYKNEAGISEYGRVDHIGQTRMGDEGVVLKAISAEEAAKLIKNDPTTKHITLTPANTVPLPPYKYTEPKRSVIDILLSPLDWIILNSQGGISGRISDIFSNRHTLNAILIMGIILFVSFMAYGFYLVAK